MTLQGALSSLFIPVPSSWSLSIISPVSLISSLSFFLFLHSVDTYAYTRANPHTLLVQRDCYRELKLPLGLTK